MHVNWPGQRLILAEIWRYRVITTPTQVEAISVLSDLCDHSSRIRLGQLLAHLGFLCEDPTGRAYWDIDDEQRWAVMYLHREELVSREAEQQQMQKPVRLEASDPDLHHSQRPLSEMKYVIA